jgi:ParB-like chromosome segregation protein Spo0J
MQSPTPKPANPSAPRNPDAWSPEVLMIEVKDLRPHPRQAELVGDMRPTDFEALVDDIRANGIQNPLIILADRTIVCGHQRHRAAVLLGMEQVPCIVREDLGDTGDPAPEKLLLTDNLRRRQLSPLEKARYTKRLVELESGRSLERETWDNHRHLAVRDAVGKLLGCTGRNAARYLAVLNTPAEIQQAFDEELLPLTLTGKISFLMPDVQQTLAESVKKVLSTPKSESQKIKRSLAALVKTAIDKVRALKKSDALTPMDPLSAIYSGLKKSFKGLEANREAIIADINSAEEVAKLFQRQRLASARSNCERLLEVLAEFQAAAEAEPDARTVSMRKTKKPSGHCVPAIT